MEAGYLHKGITLEIAYRFASVIVPKPSSGERLGRKTFNLEITEGRSDIFSLPNISLNPTSKIGSITLPPGYRHIYLSIVLRIHGLYI